MKKLDQYIADHTEAEGDLLRELDRQTNLKVMMPRMISGHVQGKVLKMLSQMIKPKYILELGTFTGYSALCMVEGLAEDGKLITIEVNDELESFSRKFISQSSRSHLIEQHIGSALDIIPKLDYTFDLIFIDADKREYLEYYHAVFSKLKMGGIILADNVLWSGKVVETVERNDTYTKGIMAFNDFVHNDPRVENVLLPIRDGLMMLRKIAE